jgi:uncharacterized protein (DUF1501 family)
MTRDPFSDRHLPGAPCADRRRALLGGLAATGLWLGGVPARAASVRPDRLVVVMLRGALDGLAAVPVPGDPAWSGLRGDAGGETPLPLDGPFAMHPRLAGLHGWYREGALLVLHATASPYRERSHFDAQQLLESGSTRPFELSTGWLGRAMERAGQRGVALGPALPLALRGAERATSWAPTRDAPADEDLLARMARLYDGDPALARSFARAREQATGLPAGMDASAGGGRRDGSPFAERARQAGQFLAPDDGPSVAWLEADGWDTHIQQSARLNRLLPALDQGLLALRDALGPRWSSTTVLVMTEFGRSAVPNGSGGTDHGTGGVALLAGGAVAGGRVLGDWPGVGRGELLERRDLRPTTDIRRLIGPVLARQFGLGAAALGTHVLPGAPAGLDGLWRA